MWAWLGVAAAAALAAYAVLVALAAAGGRRGTAVALARLLPDVAVLVARLLRDPATPRRHKLLLAALAAYLACPLDLVPDVVPVVGHLDDAAAVALVLRAVLRGAGPELVRRHWPGPPETLGALLRLAGSRRGTMPPMDVISFARGNPTPDVLPVEAFGEIAGAVIAREGRTILNYGPAGGYPKLRDWIAAQHGVDPAQVVVSTGSLAGFNFLVRHLFADGGRAVVEAPSYDRTLGVLRSLGAQIDAVPLSDDGLDLDRLESLLADGPTPKLLYTIPTFQNPSGRTLSLDQRHALVELARAKGLLVYEDDPYRLVRYSGEALPSMYELAGGEGVVFSTSFSKTGAPGLRVGYVVLPPELVKPVEAIAASMYIGPPPLPQAMLFEFVDRGLFEPNLEVVRRELRARRDAMLGALEAELAGTAAWSHPDGGYFLWLDLPAGVGVDALFARAAEAGVQFVKGTDFYDGGGGEESARLAFSFPSVEEIHEGIRRLGALVRDAARVPA